MKLRFAFHHFLEKETALAEIWRVLVPGGELSMFNLAHDYMKAWWAYRYFPSIERIDSERFIAAKSIFTMLETLGFYVRGRIETIVKRFSLTEILAEAQNRDMSPLHLIGEDEYRTGLAHIRRDGEKMDYFVGDISFLDFLAIKAK